MYAIFFIILFCCIYVFSNNWAFKKTVTLSPFPFFEANGKTIKL